MRGDCLAAQDGRRLRGARVQREGMRVLCVFGGAGLVYTKSSASPAWSPRTPSWTRGRANGSRSRWRAEWTGF